MTRLRGVPTAADQRAMESSSWEGEDTRTPAEKAADARTLVAAAQSAMESRRRRMSPTLAEIHSDTLAFCAAAIRRYLVANPEGFANEGEQYLALWNAKREQLGRCPQPRDYEPLRRASRAIWAAKSPRVTS